jgi:hypothetical protein
MSHTFVGSVDDNSLSLANVISNLRTIVNSRHIKIPRNYRPSTVNTSLLSYNEPCCST